MYVEKKFKYYKKQNKYKNKIIVNNGQKYDSILESKVGQDLEILKKAGEIKDYERQVKVEFNFIFQENGEIIFTTEPRLELKNSNKEVMHLFNYFVDFKVYHNDDMIEFIEVKGMWIEPGLTKFKLLEIYLKNKPEYKLTVMKK